MATPFLGDGGKVVLKKGLEERRELKQPIYGFALEQEVVVTGYNNKKSSLLVFVKSSIWKTVSRETLVFIAIGKYFFQTGNIFGENLILW